MTEAISYRPGKWNECLFGRAVRADVQSASRRSISCNRLRDYHLIPRQALCCRPRIPRVGRLLAAPGTTGWAQKFYSETEGLSNGPTLVQLAPDHLRVHCNHRNRIRSSADRAIWSTSTNTAFSALSQSHRPVRPNGPWHAVLLFSRAATPSCATSKHTSTDRNFEPEAPINRRSLTGPATETHFLARGSKGLARPPSRLRKIPRKR